MIQSLDEHNAAQKDDVVISRLREHQGKMSDEKFCARWLVGVSSTSWLRVKNGNYAAKDWSSMMGKLSSALRAIDESKAAKRGQTARHVLPFSFIKTVASAIALASNEDRDRLIGFLAPTGGGKSKTGAWIAEYYHERALLIEATEIWRDSYLSTCIALLGALGVSDEKMPKQRRQAEAMVLAEFARRPRILVIDEAHYMGAVTINLIKAILNHSPQTIVVAMAIPVLWERMSRSSWAEADQLRNRAKAIIQVKSLDRGDLEIFLLDRLGDQAADFSEAIYSELASACKWGLWAEAERIAQDAADDAGEGVAVTEDNLKAAIKGRVGVL